MEFISPSSRPDYHVRLILYTYHGPIPTLRGPYTHISRPQGTHKSGGRHGQHVIKKPERKEQRTEQANREVVSRNVGVESQDTHLDIVQSRWNLALLWQYSGNAASFEDVERLDLALSFGDDFD